MIYIWKFIEGMQNYLFSSFYRNVLRVGKLDILEITISLRNLLEAAYDAKIVISFPESLHHSGFGEFEKQVSIEFFPWGVLSRKGPKGMCCQHG